VPGLPQLLAEAAVAAEVEEAMVEKQLQGVDTVTEEELTDLLTPVVAVVVTTLVQVRAAAQESLLLNININKGN